MKKIVTVSGIILSLMLAVEGAAFSQGAKKEKLEDESFSIHVRAITEPERVFLRRTTEAGTVLDAVASLKTLPEGLSKMDLWIVRPGRNGKAQILPIDWAAITRQGQTKTNFLILPGDQLMIQARFGK